MLAATQWPEVAKKHPWKSVGNGNVRSTVARLSFANLFTPVAFKGNGNGGKDEAPSKPRYGVALLLPKGDTADVFAEQVREAIRENFGADCTIGTPTTGSKPTVDVDYKKNGKPARATLSWPLVDQGARLNDGYEKGSFFIACYSPEKPAIVDTKRNAIVDPKAVYSGCYAFVTVRPYYSEAWGTLAVALQGVQFLVDGERFGGGAPAINEQFEDVAGEFAAIGASAAAEAASMLD